MADKTLKFKEALEKEIAELKTKLASKEFSYEELIQMREELGISH